MPPSLSPLRHLPRAGLLAVALLAFAAALAHASPAPRERLPFNTGWRFAKDDPAGTGDALSYAKIKDWLAPTGRDFLNGAAVLPVRPPGDPGAGVAYAQPGFDDRTWRQLDLPHDWGIEGPFKQEYPGNTGKLPWWGGAWYRKTFAVPADDAARRVFLDVDGAMSHTSVWLNGHLVGGWPYGYASWRVDLTPFLKPGADNVLALRLDNPPASSRWYPGGGIYRHVWLVKTGPVHVAHWGTFVTTPLVSAASATVNIAVDVDNSTDAPVDVQVATRLFLADAAGHSTGEPVATSEALDLRITKSAGAQITNTTQISAPRLWNLKTPQRYVAETTVRQGDSVLDRIETPFGIRTIAFTADNGFLLNGERVPIQGVCNHHDLGALGAALNVRALERQLEILRSFGCNAIRTSHNPPAPELLDLCDRLGFVVMDEAFDCWRSGKTPNDYHLLFPEWHEQDLRALVRRDRNHPCVVLWSIGNEIREQSEPGGAKLAAHLAGIVREEDRSRPVSAGFHIRQNNFTIAGYNGFQTAVDVVGFNYKPAEYGVFRQRNPAIPLIASETSSCVSSRGEYFFPVSEDKSLGRVNFQVSSYDFYAPTWAMSPEKEWLGLDAFPFTAGEFVWTGFDYLGEPTPYDKDAANLLNFTEPADQARVAEELKTLGKIAVPSRSSYFGIVDLAGFPKDRFYLYQSRWRPDLPMAHILPHWNWPERVGQITPVHVYTSGDEAELFLNGRSLGRKKLGAKEYRLRWDDVKYEPGELRVVAYKHGAKWAEDVVRTTGPAAKLTLAADRTALHADGQDLSFITLTVADKDGLLVPRAKTRVTFEITGPGEIVATDNGDATSFESFQSPERSAYNGLALAIIRTKPGNPGPITLRAKSDNLTAATLTLTSQ
jgi:beta-galactosidase